MYKWSAIDGVLMAVVNVPLTEKRPDVDLASDQRWQTAERAAASLSLKRAAQLQAILLYVVRHAILEPDQPLREYEIACEVLGRRSDFTPVDDNIVRVQIGHLRKKLEQYFATEGSQEALVITLERGSYTPVFHARETTPSGSRAVPPVADAPPLAQSEEPVRAAPGANGRTGSGWLLVLGAVAVVAGLSGWWIGRAGRTTDPIDKPTAANITNPILRRVFGRSAVVNVVVADTALVFLQNRISSNISIAGYLDKSYPANILGQIADTDSRSILTDLASRRYTSLNDVDVVGLCFKWGYILGAQPVVQYARDLHVRDFEQGNFVVIGSRRGNPWTSLFDNEVNFVFEEVPETHSFHFRNRRPAPGEAATYEFTRESDGRSTGYVDIVVLPNLTHSGSVLLINGFSMETNEAAAHLIFDKGIAPDSSRGLTPEVARAINASKPNSKLEILMRVHNLDSSENGSEIVAIRTESDNAAH